GWAGMEPRIEAVSINGGTPREVVRFPADEDTTYSLVAIDDTTLFVHRSRFAKTGGHVGGDLLAVEKRLGTHEVRATSSDLFAIVMDETWLYWHDNHRIWRVPRHGGETELWLDDPSLPSGQLLDNVTVDRCNVYWTTLNGKVLMGRRH